MTENSIAGTIVELWQHTSLEAHRLNERTNGWLGILAGATREILKPHSAITAAAIACFRIIR